MLGSTLYGPFAVRWVKLEMFGRLVRRVWLPCSRELSPSSSRSMDQWWSFTRQEDCFSLVDVKDALRCLANRLEGAFWCVIFRCAPVENLLCWTKFELPETRVEFDALQPLLSGISLIQCNPLPTASWMWPLERLRGAEIVLVGTLYWMSTATSSKEGNEFRLTRCEYWLNSLTTSPGVSSLEFLPRFSKSSLSTTHLDVSLICLF